MLTGTLMTALEVRLLPLPAQFPRGHRAFGTRLGSAISRRVGALRHQRVPPVRGCPFMLSVSALSATTKNRSAVTHA